MAQIFFKLYNLEKCVLTTFWKITRVEAILALRGGHFKGGEQPLRTLAFQNVGFSLMYHFNILASI